MANSGSGVHIQINAIRPVANQGSFPRHNGASLDGLGIAGQGTVAIHGLVGACRAHAHKLDAQGIGNSVLLGQSQDLIGSILEVSNASKRNTPSLGSRDRDIETFGFIIIGQDFLGVSIGLQRSVGQTVKTSNVVSAVHVEGSASNGKNTGSIADTRIGGNDIGIIGAKVNEASASSNACSHTGEFGVDIRGRQRHDVNVVAESCRIVRYRSNRNCPGERAKLERSPLLS